MNESIRLLIVDDHVMVRKGLVELLEAYDDLDIIGEAGDGEMALIQCKSDIPDVILMDLVMPHMNGIAATRRIREIYPQIRIIILTSFNDEIYVQDALEVGVAGYLMKNISGDDLANAIRRVHAGQSTLSPEATRVLIHKTVRPPQPGHDLTEREREVLLLLVEGLTNTEIAEKLVLSKSTIKNHVSSILGKLEVKSRTKAVAIAVEYEIV